jgi:hypothetical protein
MPSAEAKYFVITTCTVSQRYWKRNRNDQNKTEKKNVFPILQETRVNESALPAVTLNSGASSWETRNTTNPISQDPPEVTSRCAVSLI